MKKPMDAALDAIDDQMLEDAKRKDDFKSILDAQLKRVQKLDNFIDWNEKKIKELEEQKQIELRKMGELLDTAMVQTHTLEFKKFTYTVKPDNKRKVELLDTAKFLGWMKKNKSPLEVLEFLKGALKKSNLKSFCEKEANNQRINGELSPSIDGVEFIGDVTYTKLTTDKKEKK